VDEALHGCAVLRERLRFLLGDAGFGLGKLLGRDAILQDPRQLFLEGALHLGDVLRSRDRVRTPACGAIVGGDGQAGTDTVTETVLDAYTLDQPRIEARAAAQNIVGNV